MSNFFYKYDATKLSIDFDVSRQSNNIFRSNL